MLTPQGIGMAYFEGYRITRDQYGLFELMHYSAGDCADLLRVVSIVVANFRAREISYSTACRGFTCSTHRVPPPDLPRVD